jgi:AcrR family transcriptional regulator
VTARVAAPVAVETGEPHDQRGRILDSALRLMGEQGAHVTSMRQLAAACGLNVATLYHYFPSKADLLRAVIEERHYFDRLREEAPAVDTSLPPRERLAALLAVVGRHAVEEEAIWRLILGESLRGEQVALDMVASLSAALEMTYSRYLVDHFPEFAGDPDAAGRVLRGEIFAVCIEVLPLPPKDRNRHVDRRARDVAAMLFPA